MKRSLASVLLAVLVVLGLPLASDAAGDTPAIFAQSTSYSSQPRPYTITVFNRLDNSRLSASISNSGIGSRSMSCHGAGAINGLGTWKCTASGRLGLGSIRITATASGGGKIRSSSTSANVSSGFGISGHTASVGVGGTYTVSGSYDHISGASDFSVQASANGQGSSCSLSGSSFTCSLRAPASISGSSSTENVTVTENGPGGPRSASTSVTVIGPGAPGSPTFSSPHTVGVNNQPLTISGSTSASGLIVQVLVDPRHNRTWSSPAATCRSNANAAFSCALAARLPAGKHTIVARAVDPADSSRVSAESSFTLTVKATPVATPTPTPTPVPSPSPSPIVTPPITTPTTPTTPSGSRIPGGLNSLLELLVLGLAVITLARPGSLALVRSASSASFTDRNATDEEPLAETVGWGDQSPTWAALGTDATDFWSRTAPPAIARHSPFLARLSIDGVAIRAMFGSLWWLFPIGGVVLGGAAASSTHFLPHPPSLGLLGAVVVLACFDATAGFLATLVFGIGVAGHLSQRGLAMVIVLGVLWCALPLVAEMLRPIRRLGLGWTYRWDRLADAVVAAVVCGWLAERVVGALDNIAGTSTGVSAHAGTIGLIAAAAIAGRVLVGHLVEIGWPERLRATSIFEELPEPRPYAAVVGFLLRVILFTIVAQALVGTCWQLFVGVLLFAAPDLFAAARTRVDKPIVRRTGLPAGLTQIVVLVVWCSLLVSFAVSQGHGDLGKLRLAFVAAAVIPSIFGLIQVVTDPLADRPRTSWKLQLGGLLVVIASTALAVHGWNY